MQYNGRIFTRFFAVRFNPVADHWLFSAPALFFALMGGKEVIKWNSL